MFRKRATEGWFLVQAEFLSALGTKFPVVVSCHQLGRKSFAWHCCRTSLSANRVTMPRSQSPQALAGNRRRGQRGRPPNNAALVAPNTFPSS